MTLSTAENEIVEKMLKLKSRKLELEKTNVMFRDSIQNEELVKIDLELAILDEKHYTEPFIKIGKNGKASNE